MMVDQSGRLIPFVMMSCSCPYASEWIQMVLAPTFHYEVMLILDETTQTHTLVSNLFKLQLLKYSKYNRVIY
jgi:hypothetical protein